MARQNCLVCGVKPARSPSKYCHNCNAKIEAERRSRRNRQPFKFLTWRGAVVGLYPRDGKGEKHYYGVMMRRSPEGLPKGKTIDLDHRCEGFSREQIKKMKSAILALSEIHVKVIKVGKQPAKVG